MRSEDEDQTLFRLKGPKVHVYKHGRLYTRAFLRHRRLITADLRGTTLSVNYHHPNQTTSYDLREAQLFTVENSHKILLQLPTKKNLCFFAHDAEEFDSWKQALTESIQWGIELFYELHEILGQGAFATVVRGLHRQTNDVVAIKKLSKTLCSEQDLAFLQREVDILQKLKHPNVIHMSDLFESPETLYVVLEFMGGGTLLSFTTSNSPLSEANVRDIMKDILRGIQYVHSKGIVHRDIKPENLMCTSKEIPTTVKILDFGLSRVTVKTCSGDPEQEEVGLGPGGLMTSPVGTPNFAAPEMLSGLPYGKEVDCFACGVVMYWLLCGYYPFFDSDPDRLLALIKQTAFEFPEREWCRVSDEAKDVIGGLLDRSPYERLSAEQALQHRWFHMQLPTNAIQNAAVEEQWACGALSRDQHMVGTNIDLGDIVNVRNVSQTNTGSQKCLSLQAAKIPTVLDDWQLLEQPPERSASWKR